MSSVHRSPMRLSVLLHPAAVSYYQVTKYWRHVGREGVLALTLAWSYSKQCAFVQTNLASVLALERVFGVAQK